MNKPLSRLGFRAGLVAVATLVSSGCSNLPRPVSTYKEVKAASADGSIHLVPVTESNIPRDDIQLSSFPASFTQGPDFDFSRIGTGDQLQVRIWESGTPTVFTSSAASDLGQLTVDDSGDLYLPFVGTVHADGLTIPELRATILRRLKTVVLRPQVDVREVQPRSRLVTVQGEAEHTGVLPIDRGRTKLSELLAEVGPKIDSPDMALVTVRRGGKSASVRLSDLYQNPELDLPLRPGDTVLIHGMQQSVTVLGAAGVQGQIRISKRDFSLLDALGQAHGLNPEAADPRAVFVMRPQAVGGPPTVYQVNFRRPDAIALAGRFDLHDGDAVMISSAPWAQTRQVIAAFSQGMASLRSLATIPTP